MNCKNCNSKVNHNYCPNCGQKRFTDRFILSQILSDFFGAFSISGSFFLTIRKMLFQPDEILNNYVGGKTKAYLNPVKFVILLLSINVLLTTLISKNKESFDIVIINKPYWVLLSLFLFVLIFSLFSYAVSRKKYNYTENLIINIYIFGIVQIIGLFTNSIRLILLNYDLGLFGFTLTIGLPITYMGWAYMKTFNKSIFIMLLLSFISFFTAYLILTITVKMLGFDI